MKSSREFRTCLASIRRLSVLALTLSAAAWGSGFFGTVVPIGGHASDIALDEGRGVLYIANYTANRIEVMSTSDRSIGTSINVPFPGALALSRDGRYLVVTTYSNFQTPNGQPNNLVTIIALETNVRRTVALSNPPLAVAFGADGLALVLTTTEFLLLDPATASAITLDTVAAIGAKVLPVAAATFPPQILTASMGASGNGQLIYGFTDTLQFLYSVPDQAVVSGSYISTPTLGPRVVSVNDDGSMYLSGWAAYNTRQGLSFEFTNVSGALNIGSHAIDSRSGLIYAQIPDAGPAAAPPTSSTQCFPNGICITLTTPPPPGAAPAVAGTPPNLMIVDADNLTVRRRLLLAENLGGRSILNSAGDTMYSVSDSGVTVFPVGQLNRQAQVSPSQEDLVFLGAFCNRQTLTQDITISNPGGGATDFRLSLADPALAQSISFSATSGTTPATIRVTINPAAFQNLNGTSSAYVRIDSDSAVNLQPATCPKPAGTSAYANGCFRLLINNREPDQRGTLVGVPGLLVDVLSDPTRNRFYVLRQDTNQVLVYNGANNSQVGTLRTGPTPMQMAITPDGKYMLVGLNDGHFISVFDLDTLEPSQPIRMPGGHYPRSIAIAGQTILVASRVAGPVHQISRVDFEARTAAPLPTLGPFENKISEDTILVASPHGAYIMAAMPDGNLLLYDANADTFTVSRKDYGALSGAYAANDQGQFAIDNNILNQSLSRIALLDKGQGGTSGFAFSGQTVFRTGGLITTGSGTAAGSAVPGTPGLIERLDLARPASPVMTRTIEAPVFPTATGGASVANGTVISGGTSFIRSLAMLSNGNIISLTQSGFTVLPPNFDAATAKPVVTSVVNPFTNDPKQLTAGGPIAVNGSNLAQTTVSSSADPAPTVLGDSCVTINGAVVPLFMVSRTQINGQLPLNVSGGQLVIHTPGGVSDPVTLNTQVTAPAVIQTPGDPTVIDKVPAVYRSDTGLPVTLTNPVHKGDRLTIFASGLGPTLPTVPAGSQTPANPPALLVASPVVTLDGATCPVTFAGLAPGMVGVYRIDVNVPKGIQQGLSIALTVEVGGNKSTPVYVRVVE
ncbi:MAG TPA: hypothetical protein VL285_16480 [Bryobacteraceae bacterium]|nr:hypothetical protein [Bryobacteraceae bacterium]